MGLGLVLGLGHESDWAKLNEAWAKSSKSIGPSHRTLLGLRLVLDTSMSINKFI